MKAINVINPTDLSFSLFEFFCSLAKKNMIAAKRRRDGSTVATPTVSQSSVLRPSSFAQSSPLLHLQPIENSEQRHTESYNLRHRSDHSGSAGLSSNLRPAYSYSRLSSAAASAVDVARENRTEGEEEGDSDSAEVIMCVDMRERGTVGCCYYESSTGVLHLVEDIQCGGLEVIDTCKCAFAIYLCTD